ncbi:MAG: carboxy terminal-processing peptidase [Endozoicomonas sp. (ex Botrylloides leachii)]|nr:carboxy terminal-processing peptidase [Endozoicomonas sp. (ex Botrylloides leachii)]
MRSFLQLARQMTLVLLSFILLTSSAFAASPDLNKPLPKLSANLQQAIASVNAVQILDRNHYGKVNLDQASGEKAFDRYIERLDPNRSFFTQKDINGFAPYKEGLSKALKNGNLKPAFAIFNRYRKRTEERARFMLAELNKGASAFDFNLNEKLLIDRKEAPWPKNKKALHKLWHKQLKNSLLTLILNNKTNKEAIDQLVRRNKNLLRRLYQSKSEDAFQTYINAFTAIYDPHTQYFSPQTAENFDINMSLSLEGIGAVLQSEDEHTKVVSVVTGGPAEKAGQLKPGDKIIGVAQGKKGAFEDIVGMRLDDAVKLIRGPKNTLVRLEVIPNTSKDGRTHIYNITRDKVKLEDQDAKSRIITLEDKGKKQKIGVIELPTFYVDFKAAQAGDPNYKSTTRDVRRLINNLKKQNIEGLIIDLRGNGGGSLQEANDLTGLFIDHGPTVIVKDSRGRIDIQKDNVPGQVYSGPMVVMIDRLSASASEIFAGAMQDYGRALVIGSQSYGKGTVQSIQPLNYGQLKYTLAKFYRVSGKSTQNKGVLPDIKFPSLYDGQDIGERTLPDALPWDTIPAVKYKTYVNFTPYLKTLREKHEKRTVKAADFIYLKEIKDYLASYEKKKTVSLNEKKRRLQLNTMRSKRLAIENRLRKAHGEKLLNNLDELEDSQADNANNKKDKNKNKPDPFLKEAGLILTDYLALKQPHKLQS